MTGPAVAAFRRFAEAVRAMPAPSEAQARFALEWSHLFDLPHLYRDGREAVFRQFREIGFPLPPGTPSTFRVWRGASGPDIEKAADGVSWSMHRGAACLYAVRAPCPLVLTAQVSAESVVAYLDGFLQAEVVLAESPRDIAVCGGPPDWQHAAHAYGQWTADRWDRLIWEGGASPVQATALRIHVRAKGLQDLVPHLFEGGDAWLPA